MAEDNHITYLFGAGASYKSMPVVAELTSDIVHWATSSVRTTPVWADSERKQARTFSPTDQGRARWMKLHDQVQEVAKSITQFDTIDTLARFYWLQSKHEELYRLKKVVDAYFAIRHFAPELRISLSRTIGANSTAYPKGDYDSRYDSFFAAILENGGEMNSNVSLATYNYDLEVEQSLAKFTESSLSSCVGSVYHINGHASIEAVGTTYDDVVHHIEIQGGRSIKYAWEPLANGDSRVEEVRRLFENTTHLVVVGYSFPVFNCEIDRVILYAPNLKKIYIQDLPTALKGVKNRVKALLGERSNFIPAELLDVSTKDEQTWIEGRPARGVQIKTVDSVDQFHIPFEMI